MKLSVGEQTKELRLQIQTKIMIRNNKIVAKLEKESRCRHVWKQHGFGNKCLRCGYYTGQDEELNKLIASLNNSSYKQSIKS